MIRVVLYTQTVPLGPGCLAVISQLAFNQGWSLRGVPLYTVYIIRIMSTTSYSVHSGTTL